MAKQDYLPNDSDDLDTWYQTWLGAIASVLSALGLVSTHADATITKVNTARTSFANWKAKKAEAESFSDTFQADRKLAEEAIRPYSKNLKTTPGYTEAMGDTIGIEGDEETVDASSAKPKVKGTYEGGQGILKFNTHPAARSVRFTSRRADEGTFTFLSDDTNSPYPDARPNFDPSRPEKREYRGQYVDKDGNLIGLISDTITITFPAIIT